MPKGLYDKFTITRNDGQSAPGQKHDGCEYFVLDITHDHHARQALVAYAMSCRNENPELASALEYKAKMAGYGNLPTRDL